MRGQLRAMLVTVAAALVFGGSTTTGAQQSSSFDPTGGWEGPCKSKDQSDGTLHVEFRREGRAWRAKGGMKSPGYPYSESEFEEVKVDGSTVSFVGLWGPMIAEFAGAHKDAKLTGDLRLVRGEKVVGTCVWVLARLAAK